MVRVVAGLLNHGNGVLELHAAGDEQADHLGDDHGGVRVVDLDASVLGELLGLVAGLGELVQDELGAGGHHEVLLAHAQDAALLVGVVGVQEAREAAVKVRLVEVDALGESQGRGW